MNSIKSSGHANPTVRPTVPAPDKSPVSLVAAGRKALLDALKEQARPTSRPVDGVCPGVPLY